MSNRSVIVAGIVSILLAVISANYRTTDYVYGFYAVVKTPYAELTIPLFVMGIILIVIGIVFFNPPVVDNEAYNNLKKHAVWTFVILLCLLISGWYIFTLIKAGHT